MGNYNSIKPLWNKSELLTDGLSKPSLDSIPNHGIPDLTADSEPHPSAFCAVRGVDNHHPLTPNAVPGALHTLDLR